MNKHDLSHDLVKLDYPTLLATVQSAVYCNRVNCERALSEIQYADENVRPKDVSSLTVGYFIARSARNLAQYAKSLADCAETLEALEGMKTREDLVILNKP